MNLLFLNKYSIKYTNIFCIINFMYCSHVETKNNPSSMNFLKKNFLTLTSFAW